MLDNSFTWWLVNLAVTIAFLTASVVTGSYFVAIAGVIYLVVMMLVELPGTSSEEGSTDDSEVELP